MKLEILLIFCLVVTAVIAKRDRSDSKRKLRERGKRFGRQRALEATIQDEDDGEDYESLESQVQGQETNERQSRAQETSSTNPCNTEKCGRGETCILEDDVPVCVCVPECPQEPDERFRVCSSKNVTYETECHLDRDHCLCSKRQPGCSDARLKKVRLDYFAACKELPECPKEQFDQFAERMRDWIYQVMEDLSNAQELDEYREVFLDASEDEAHGAAVMWKFCDLDVHPSDKQVSRRELMYIEASIKAMEPCLVPFLDSCDTNGDRHINREEWGTCLEISQDKFKQTCLTYNKNRG